MRFSSGKSSPAPAEKLQKKRRIVSRAGEIRVFVSRDFSAPAPLPTSPKPANRPSGKGGSAHSAPTLAPAQKDKRLLIKSGKGGAQASVVEDGILVEHYASGVTDTMVGNIYLGMISKLSPGLDAAFVDLGEEKDGILHLPSQKERGGRGRVRCGDAVLVQVSKDPRGRKGPLLSDKIALSGRFMLLMSKSDMVGASAKLEPSERRRLKEILRAILPDGEGGIARTAAANCAKEALKKDYADLKAVLKDVEARFSKLKRAHSPALLKSDSDVALKATRDIFNGSFSRLQVQGKEFKKVRAYVKERNPELLERVEEWDPALEKKDIFEAYGIESQISQGLERVVELPGGGTLVIDKTEAMTTIDVNSAKSSSQWGNAEKTATECNLEAAREIGRQLRLRDVGGIVIVDFVNMRLETDKEQVLCELKKALEADRAKHEIEGITSLGLVQISRHKLGHGLVESFSRECENCHGRGVVISRRPAREGGSNNAAPQV